jgi:transcriptional regulator with XRE-family HTH domain
MNRTPRQDLIERLKDPEYAKLYGEEDAKVDFAITLTKARRSLNLTQRSLADKLGISQPYVAKLEGGEANPTLGTIGRLLATINLRLVTGTAPLKPEPMPSFVGLVLMGAANAVDMASYLRAFRLSEEIPWGFESPYDLPVNAGTVSVTTPIGSTRYRAREVIAGGAAR